MSVIVKNSIQMSKSQLNHSKSKQTYSFPRESRFSSHRSGICENLYDLPSTRRYGNRSESNSHRDITPGPSNYDQSLYTTQDDLNKKKGWTMGVSRERMEMFGILPNTNVKTPGPGSFVPKSTLSSISFTMRSKPKLNPLDLKKNYPGPGSYENLPALNPQGKYQNSKMANPSTERFPPQHQDKNPGPCEYEYFVKTGLSPVGNYFISNLHNSKCRTFNRADTRNTSTEQSMIGPGAYQLGSEFGIYEAKRKGA